MILPLKVTLICIVTVFFWYDIKNKPASDSLLFFSSLNVIIFNNAMNARVLLLQWLLVVNLWIIFHRSVSAVEMIIITVEMFNKLSKYSLHFNFKHALQIFGEQKWIGVCKAIKIKNLSLNQN